MGKDDEPAERIGICSSCEEPDQALDDRELCLSCQIEEDAEDYDFEFEQDQY